MTYCVSCQSSAARGRHVRECDRFEVCTLEPVSPGVRDCRNCPPDVYQADPDPPPDVE